MRQHYLIVLAACQANPITGMAGHCHGDRNAGLPEEQLVNGKRFKQTDLQSRALCVNEQKAICQCQKRG